MKPTCSIPACVNPRFCRGLCQNHYQQARYNGQLEQHPTMLIATDSDLETRLHHHGWAVTESGCWEWNGHRMKTGYGRLAVGGGRTMLATRAAWSVWRAPLTPDQMVLHVCDNPPCINPEHLFIGTRADNTADMIGKRRIANGERKVHKLTDAQVDEIRSRYASTTITQKALAEDYGVSRGHIHAVVRHKRRQTLTNPPLPR